MQNLIQTWRDIRIYDKVEKIKISYQMRVDLEFSVEEEHHEF